MAFLDNSGDIILDAVLTDTGRFRLAQGNGSFRIAKFALGDDEIDYSLYNKNASGGSAYYDLDILSLPVLEAFTNNVSSLKSKLLSISRTNLLYLPIIKLNATSGTDHTTCSNAAASGVHVLAVNSSVYDAFGGGTANPIAGVIDGYSKNGTRYIRVDQGIDSTDLPATSPVDIDLREDQYILEVDDRLIKLAMPIGRTISAGTQIRGSFIDDDQVAIYNINQTANSDLVKVLQPKVVATNGSVGESSGNQNGTIPVISGPRGTKLEFALNVSDDLISSNYLFSTLGSTITVGSTTTKYIDTNIRITGATTGFRIDVPVRIMKV